MCRSTRANARDMGEKQMMLVMCEEVSPILSGLATCISTRSLSGARERGESESQIERIFMLELGVSLNRVVG